MGPSKTPNKAEREWMDAIAQAGCCACKQEGYTTPAEVHHITSAGRRMGHLFTIPLCRWHHQLGDADRPSVHGAKRSFEAKYGTQLELLARLKVELGFFDAYEVEA